MSLDPVILISIIALVVIAIVWFLLRNQYEPKIERLTEERAQLMELRGQHLSTIKNLEEQLQHLRGDEERLKQQFQVLAQDILESKAKKFDEDHRKGLKDLLEPLKEKIAFFEKRVEKTNIDQLERSSQLREQLKHLKELNAAMTNEARNLTRALKGDVRTQGSWGELILESILERSGLEKGREYVVQESITTKENKRLRPDVIIHLPDGKRIIIDSKVSLTAYEEFVNAEDETTRETSLQAHILSLRSHITNLSRKNYHDLYKMESPDFVLMFIPIETAFSVALNKHGDLYQSAFDQNIVIVTPSTLLATLKTVDSMWRNEKQNRYALKIAEEAGKMYDKFALLAQDLESLGKRIDQTRIAYDDSMKKLQFGRGNLVSRAEKLRKLGAKASKSLPKDIAEAASEEE